MGQFDNKVLSGEIRDSQTRDKIRSANFFLALHFFRDLSSYIITRLVQFFRIARAAFELTNILFTKLKSLLVVRLFWGRGNFYKNFFRFGLVIALFGWIYSTLSGSVTSSTIDYADTLYVMQKKDYEIELGSMSPPIDKNRPRDSVQEYVVQGGDTISAIAEKFDISVDTIKWSNGLTSDYIRPGQNLKILPVTGVLHKVKGGDTLSSIADKYKASEQAIADVNWIDPPFILQEGVELMVPGGSIQAPVPSQSVITTAAQVNVAPQTTTPAVSGTGQFIMPTAGYISQYYWRWHRAVDIANKGLPDVVAADSGRVFYSGWDSSGYGLTILIDHGNGFVTRYAHASSLYVRSGEYVTRGQPIMRMGSTGRSTGVHLHFEVILNGVYQNPLSYL